MMMISIMRIVVIIRIITLYKIMRKIWITVIILLTGYL